jgi:aminomethyltransferase
MKKTALYHVHVAAGAKMVPFAGFDMPLQYSGLLPEHHAVRQAAGMFDVSHMGEFMVSGPQALALLQSVTSNDVSKLSPGKIQYSCLPNATGGIVDDLLVYCLAPEKYMLVVNASNIEKDWAWIQAANQHFGAHMTNVSDDWSLIAVQGPKATEILQSLSDAPLTTTPYYHFVEGNIGEVQGLILSNTGYTGAGGFEIYVPNAQAEKVWHLVQQAGAAQGLLLAGLAARDTLRLEMGFCLYGNDIDDTTSPIEAGLGWITKFTKAFTNHEALKAQKENGPAMKLFGIEMVDKGIPRQGYVFTNAEGQEIGRVTSGTQSPSLQKAIGMGYMPAELANPGKDIYVLVRGKLLLAKTTSFPFYKPS